MKKLTAAIALALVLPAGAFADSKSSTTNAAATCRAERAAMGAKTFADTYGTNKHKSNAFGKCVSKHARLAAGQNSNAAKQCKAEQNDANFAATHGGKTFDQFYGTNKNGKNAYGKCVSAKAKAAAAAQQAADISAAAACKAERAADAAAFKAKYGTNTNKANAFGKCVSAKAKAVHHS